MSKRLRRTDKRKSFFPRVEHECRSLRKGRQRELNLHMKALRVASRYSNPLVVAQIACHAVFDRLWCGPDAPLNRERAYRYLQQITGLARDECHISQCDFGMCEAIADQVKADYPHLFEEGLAS